VAAPFLPADPGVPRAASRAAKSELPPGDDRARDEFDLPPEANTGTPRSSEADSAQRSDQFEFDEFESKFFGADYPPGTEISFATAGRSIRAKFGVEHVDMSYDPDGPLLETSRRTVDDFWKYLRYEHVDKEIGLVTVVQPSFIGSAADRVFDILQLKDGLDGGVFTTETTMHFRDDTGTKTAVIRYDGSLQIRSPRSTPGERQRVVTGEEFIGLLGEHAVKSVRVTLPTPKSWYRVRPGEGNLFSVLAHILNQDNPYALRHFLVGHLNQNGSHYTELITNDHIDSFWNNPKNHEKPRFRAWILGQRAAVLQQEMAALGGKGTGNTDNRFNGPGRMEFSLYMVARLAGMNITVLGSGRPRSSSINQVGGPIIFLRRADDGGYELGVTDDGRMFSTAPPRKPVFSDGPGIIPKEQIPPPLTKMLAGGPEPLLLGAALQKPYLAELRPTVPRTTVARPDSVPDLTQRRIGSFAPIHYMDDLERESHRLFVGPDGRLYNARDGRPFDTAKHDPNTIFVMDEFSNMYAAEKIRGLIQHSSFLGGRTAAAAGFIGSHDGYITWIIDHSGHYVPDLQLNDYALAMLKTQGLRLADNFERRYVGNDDHEVTRSSEADEEAQRTALARAQRILTQGPTLTRPFRLYQTDQLLTNLTWNDFPPGTTIIFHNNAHSVTATVTEYRDFQVIDHHLDGFNNIDRYVADLDTLEALVKGRGITTVRVERPELPPRAPETTSLTHGLDSADVPHAAVKLPHPLSAHGDAVPSVNIPGRSTLGLTSSRIPLLGYPANATPHPGRTRPQPLHDTPVRSMDAGELESHRLFLGPDGRLFRAVDGRLFDTTQAESGRVPFVMDESGNLYAGQVADHRSFLGEHAASAMGVLAVREGRLTTWSDHSGDHTPPPENTDYALDLLRRQGLSLADDFARLDCDGRVRDRIGELDRQRTELAHRQITLDAATEILTRKAAEPPAEPGTLAHRTLQDARRTVNQQQNELDRRRRELATGAIDEVLQDKIFAHPAPVGPLDRITPPYPGELDEGSEDLEAWWAGYGRGWWDSLHFEDLQPEHQLRMLDAYPNLRIGGGIPPSVRDTLNRRYLQLGIARLDTPAGTTELSPGLAHRRKSMRETLANLYAAEWDVAFAAGLHGLDVPPVRLLSFEHDIREQEMSATIAIGHADISAEAQRHVPESSASDSINHTISQAAQHHMQTVRTTPGHLTVVPIDRYTVRRFRTASAGDTFGRQNLPAFGDLPAKVQDAVLTHDRDPSLNLVLENITSDHELPAWIDRLRTNAGLADLLSKPHKMYPNPNKLEARRVELAAKGDRTEVEERALHALNEIRPVEEGAGERWDRIVTDTDLHRDLTHYFRDEYDQEFTADTVEEVLGLLDRATEGPLRLSEPILAVGPLESLDSLATDGEGSLLDVVQRERGYPEMSVGPITGLLRHSDFIVAWVVPDGTPGLYLGTAGSDPEQNILRLARGTRYRITDITAGRDPGDSTILRAEVLPPPTSGQPVDDSTEDGSGSGSVPDEPHHPAPELIRPPSKVGYRFPGEHTVVSGEHTDRAVPDGTAPRDDLARTRPAGRGAVSGGTRAAAAGRAGFVCSVKVLGKKRVLTGNPKFVPPSGTELEEIVLQGMHGTEFRWRANNASLQTLYQREVGVAGMGDPREVLEPVLTHMKNNKRSGACVSVIKQYAAPTNITGTAAAGIESGKLAHRVGAHVVELYVGTNGRIRVYDPDLDSRERDHVEEQDPLIDDYLGSLLEPDLLSVTVAAVDHHGAPDPVPGLPSTGIDVLDHTHLGAPPTSDHTTDESNSTPDEITDPCPVCLEPFLPGRNVALTTCGHVYHADCLGTWLRGAQTCPMCRTGLDSRRDVFGAESVEQVVRWQRAAVGRGVPVQDIARQNIARQNIARQNIAREDIARQNADGRALRPEVRDALEQYTIELSFVVAGDRLGRSSAEVRDAVDMAVEALGAEHVRQVVQWQREAVRRGVLVEDIAREEIARQNADGRVLRPEVLDALEQLAVDLSFVAAGDRLGISGLEVSDAVDMAVEALGAEHVGQVVQWQREAVRRGVLVEDIARDEIARQNADGGALDPADGRIG